jgi:hypothetical protein
MNLFFKLNQSNGKIIFNYECLARVQQANSVRLAGLFSPKVRKSLFFRLSQTPAVSTGLSGNAAHYPITAFFRRQAHHRLRRLSPFRY